MLRVKKFARKKINQGLDETHRQKTICSVLTLPGWVEIRNEVYSDIDAKIEKSVSSLIKGDIEEAKKLAIEAKSLENFVYHIEGYLSRIEGR